MALQERITTKSFKTKMELVSYVNEILYQSDADSTLQLTIVIEQGGFGACSVIPAITDSFPPLKKIQSLHEG